MTTTTSTSIPSTVQLPPGHLSGENSSAASRANHNSPGPPHRSVPWQDAQSRLVIPPARRHERREVPRRARRARRRRRLGCPQPARPSQRPRPRRPAHRGRPGRRLVLSTFDYETSARATLNAEVADEGTALVSGRLLADICRSLPAKPVEMVLDGSRVSLTCGSARFSLQTMPVEDYPTLPDMPAATGTVRATRSPTRSPRRSPPPARRHAPGAHRCPHRDRRATISLLATDRFRLSHRELGWTRNTPTSRRPRWSRPRCSATPPSR
jgi:hypothetical protein